MPVFVPDSVSGAGDSIVNKQKVFSLMEPAFE